MIDGVNADEYALGPLRQNIALVSQQVTLFNASIADNIAYGVADPDPAAIKAAAEAAYASEFIEKLPESYATVVGENGVMLSGGSASGSPSPGPFLKMRPF